MRVSGITSERGLLGLLSGIPLEVSHQVPEGTFIRANYGGDRVFAGPLTAFAITHNGHYPFESFYTRGAAEVRRERRRRAKK